MADAIFAQLITSGPMGCFVLYLIINQQRIDKKSAEERARRDKLDAARIEMDRDLATSLATLATLIQGMSR